MLLKGSDLHLILTLSSKLLGLFDRFHFSLILTGEGGEKLEATMWRRIYFSFPSVEQARRVVAELETAGVKRERIHTVARPDVEISGLPAANDAQRRDRVWFWDRAFWYGNLTYFAVALSAAVLALYLGSPGWASVAAVAAVALVILGQRFVVKLPHIHLSELRIPFAHGEVILLVDVPRSRVHEIEQAVSRHHPEAGLGGVGWTIVSAGI